MLMDYQDSIYIKLKNDLSTIEQYKSWYGDKEYHRLLPYISECIYYAKDIQKDMDDSSFAQEIREKEVDMFWVVMSEAILKL
jgi:hypothetical protein